MLTLFELVEEDIEIIEGLGTKGANQANDVLQSPTTTIFWPCPLPSLGSEVYKGVLGQMTQPKQAR